MLEEANTTESIADSGPSAEPLAQVFQGSEAQAGRPGVFPRVLRGDRMVEVFIFGSILVVALLFLSDGLFASRAASSGAGAMAVAADGDVGTRVRAMVHEGVTSIERGLADGAGAIQQMLTAAKLASRAKPVGPEALAASIGAKFAKDSDSDPCPTPDWESFFPEALVKSIAGYNVVHAIMSFPSESHLRGCALVATRRGSNSVFSYRVDVCAAPEVLAGGFRRNSVTYSLVLEVGEDNKITSGRLRVELPAVGLPMDDGVGNDFYRLGDELAWVGDVTCAGWLFGRPMGEGLQYDEDERGAPVERRRGGRPPADLLKRVVDAVRELVARR
jgi:hypothetical protein